MLCSMIDFCNKTDTFMICFEVPIEKRKKKNEARIESSIKGNTVRSLFWNAIIACLFAIFILNKCMGQNGQKCYMYTDN